MVMINGFCDERFRAVREEFQRNFDEREEVGAAIAIHLDGKPVVDLWAGVADRETGRPWTPDTMVVVFSSTKGLAALCIHMLIDRGLLDVEAPVARYWPEFAAAGKQDITVAQVLSHQAGLPYWQQDLPRDAMLDWDLIAGRLAAEAPIWEPGTTHGYHGLTIGVIEGELVRRITGRSIGRFLREEVAEPLGADVWIGLPETQEHRVAPLIFADFNPRSPMAAKLLSEPDWHGWKLINNGGGHVSLETANSPAYHAAELPAVGGIANARGLARTYAALSRDGSVDGIRLVGPDALPAMRTVRSASSCDHILRLPTSFTLGFSKSWGSRSLGQGEHVILGEQAFGTPGMGGSIGFADGQAGLSFGYVMNRHGTGVGLNDRGQSLVDAAYRAVGFTGSAAGFWVR